MDGHVAVCCVIMINLPLLRMYRILAHAPASPASGLFFANPALAEHFSDSAKLQCTWTVYS